MRTDFPRHVSAPQIVILTMLALLAFGCSLTGPSPQEVATQTAIARLQASMDALNQQSTAAQNAAATKTQNARATSTAVAQALAAVQANETATAQSALSDADVAHDWQLAMYDAFDENVYGWPEGADTQSQWADVSFSVTGGVLKCTATSRQGFEQWIYPSRLTPLTDFYVSVKAELDRDEPAADYGLIFRADTSTYAHYGFIINEGGGYAIYILNKARVSNVLKSGRTSLLATGGNRLAVKGMGSRFTFYVNGQSVADLSDDRLSTGTVGLSLDLNHRGVELTFRFDDFTVLKP